MSWTTFKKRLECIFVYEDHDWDSVRGYYDTPNHGATCNYCGKVNR